MLRSIHQNFLLASTCEQFFHLRTTHLLNKSILLANKLTHVFRQMVLVQILCSTCRFHMINVKKQVITIFFCRKTKNKIKLQNILNKNHKIFKKNIILYYFTYHIAPKKKLFFCFKLICVYVFFVMLSNYLTFYFILFI